MKKLPLVILIISFIACRSNEEKPRLSSHLDGDLEIRSMQDLEDPAVQAYKSINGVLKINYADDIIDLRMLQNLESVDGIFIKNNKNLTSLNGLNNIISIGFLEIENNTDLVSLNGLDNLKQVGNGFRLVNNDKLENLENLGSLESIGIQLFISDNKSLNNLTGLENLVMVEQLIIFNNIHLTSIDGIEGITSSSDIRIDSNDSLVDFCSLKSLVQNNKDSIYFIARNNNYNPSIEDMINNNCSKY